MPLAPQARVALINGSVFALPPAFSGNMTLLNSTQVQLDAVLQLGGAANQTTAAQLGSVIDQAAGSLALAQYLAAQVGLNVVPVRGRLSPKSGLSLLTTFGTVHAPCCHPILVQGSLRDASLPLATSTCSLNSRQADSVPQAGPGCWPELCRGPSPNTANPKHHKTPPEPSCHKALNAIRTLNLPPRRWPTPTASSRAVASARWSPRTASTRPRSPRSRVGG